VLYEHPDVAAVAVVGLPDPRLQERACAVVVPQRKGDLVPIGVDEHPRATSLEALGRLRPLFPDGTVTAGNGGAIALGHPLGASGARLALTAALELHDRGARRALATMGIGVGQGIAVLFEAA
jgi:acetyl-CoA acetyltransferase